MVINQILIDVTGQMRQFSGIHHADCHSIAVPPAEVLQLFNGMGQCVTVVEELTQTFLLEIGGNVIGLDRYRAFDKFGDHILQRRTEERGTVESTKFISASTPAGV